MASEVHKISKVGEGTYGIVYEADACISEPNECRRVAVKRNLLDESVDGIGNICELDMLSRLKGHPFIVDLISVSFGDPFTSDRPMSPVDKQTRKKVKEDKVHFIMEYVSQSGDNFICSNECSADSIKILCIQLLLGIEYIHAKDVSHRDLKPGNLLISNEENEGLRLRICDFGMSQILSKASPVTPGATTSWYRAPEVCCAWDTYGKESDMWSIGCILFELCSKKAYMEGVRDSDSDVFTAIVGRSPKSIPQKTLKEMMSKGQKLSVSSRGFPIRRKSFIEQMALSDEFIEEFNSTAGSLDEYIDLIDHLLQINPNDRYTATQALNHPFFKQYNEYIQGVRELYPPYPNELPKIKIIDCIERLWMIRIAFSLFNRRKRYSWYKHRIIFHAIDLFDRYLEWAFNGGMNLRPKQTNLLGRLHSKQESELRFYVCLYLIHKYYSTMTCPFDWDSFSPKEFQKESNKRIAEQFETVLVRDVLNYSIYRDTLFEIPEQYGKQVNDKEIRKLLYGYWAIREWSGKSVRSLYRVIEGIDKIENLTFEIPDTQTLQVPE